MGWGLPRGLWQRWSYRQGVGRLLGHSGLWGLGGCCPVGTVGDPEAKEYPENKGERKRFGTPVRERGMEDPSGCAGAPWGCYLPSRDRTERSSLSSWARESLRASPRGRN